MDAGVLNAPVLPYALGAFGLVFGSFVTALSYRLPRGESVAHGRSRCPACGHTLTAPDLVPVFSWIANKGACRHCRAAVSWRYPAIEAVTAALFVSAGFFAADVGHLALLMAMAPVMMALAVVDLEHMRLPNGLLALLALAALIWRGLGDKDFITAGMAAAGCLLIGYALDRLTKTLTKQTGMGMGDTKLFAVAGLALPLGNFFTFVALAGVLGLAWGVIWRAWAGRGGPAAFPFAPAILLGFWASLVLAPAIARVIAAYSQG